MPAAWQRIDDATPSQQPAGVCNLYNLKRSRSEIVGIFQASDHWQADRTKPYVAPGLDGPVVIARDRQRISGLMTWGVPNAGKRVTNVRNLASPFWRDLLAAPRHRCLVPATEFEEWGASPDPLTGKKRAHWFSIRSRPVFAFAGIWRKVGDTPCYAFLTTAPNALVAAVHPKAMPVILDEADYDAWLTAGWDEAAQLVTAYPSQLMAAG